LTIIEEEAAKARRRTKELAQQSLPRDATAEATLPPLGEGQYVYVLVDDLPLGAQGLTGYILGHRGRGQQQRMLLRVESVMPGSDRVLVTQGRTNPFEIPRSKVLRMLPRSDYPLRWAWGWQDDFLAITNAHARAKQGASSGKDKREGFLETESQSLLPLPTTLDPVGVRVFAARIVKVFHRFDDRRKYFEGEDVQRQFLSNLLAHYSKKWSELPASKQGSSLVVRLLSLVSNNGGGLLEFLAQLTQDFSREPLPAVWTVAVMNVRQTARELVAGYMARFVESVELIPPGYLDPEGAMMRQFCEGLVLNLHPSYSMAQARVLKEIGDLDSGGVVLTLARVRDLVKLAVEDLYPLPVAQSPINEELPKGRGSMGDATAEGEKPLFRPSTPDKLAHEDAGKPKSSAFGSGDYMGSSRSSPAKSSFKASSYGGGESRRPEERGSGRKPEHSHLKKAHFGGESHVDPAPGILADVGPDPGYETALDRAPSDTDGADASPDHLN
jgi:hypothetical protein